MRLRSWIPLLLLLVVGETLAAKWVSITDGSTRAVYLDSEPLQRDGAAVRTWVREVYTQEQRSPHTGVLYYSANSLVQFECIKRTTTPLTRVFFGGDGTELRRVSLDAVEVPALVSPGSLQEQLLERACRPPEDPKAPKQHAQKPADGPTKVALADTKPHSDVPAVADAVKPASAEAAKPASAEAAKPASTGAAKPAAADPKAAPAAVDTPKRPVTDGKAALPQAIPSKFVERKPEIPAALRAYLKSQSRAVYGKPVRKETKAPAAPPPESVRWSYDGKGAPSAWGHLQPEFAACSEGKRQSPIDIQDGAKLELDPIKFDYKPAPLRIIDNGHTVQVNFSEGSSITVSGVRYELKQFHFHKPSEERIDGKAYDMVAHLVHKSSDGRLAVVAVLMEAGTPNPFIAALWPHLPLESGREVSLPEVMVDLNGLLPETRSYFAYMGSLTTPPCTEGVLWLVMKTPVTVASEQVGIFGKLYSMNARPVQPANGRLIKESL
jgi:carbonic anhydrase